MVVSRIPSLFLRLFSLRQGATVLARKPRPRSSLLAAWLVAAGGLVLLVESAAAQEPARAAYLDPAQPMEIRVRDLISRLTLEEKAGLMKNASDGVPRLGIPSYDWWNEALHGVARAGEATVFPQAIGLAAMWDEAFMRDVADAISTEGRAKYHEAVRQGQGGERYRGLTFWSPNINIFRDPRWGRGQETYGEDPFLTARMGVAFVRGLQGDDPHYLKSAACAKHFAVHSGPEALRYSMNVNPEPADFHETYLPAFEALVREGRVEAVMSAYSSLYGQPTTINEQLYFLLYNRWGFDGHVVSDCGAVYTLFEIYKIARDFPEAEAIAIKAGLCLRCGEGPATLAEAVRRGLATEAEVDTRLEQLLRTLFRLGLFDPPERVPYAQIPISDNNSPQHAALALEAARKSIVLLKNDGVLPLRAGALKRVAVIGPNADSVLALLGNYHGTPTAPVTILAGLRAALGAGMAVSYSKGCDYVAAPRGLATVPRTALFSGDFSTARDGDYSGLEADYFDNPRLEGQPAAHRRDHQIEFAWKEKPPAEGVPLKDFSARWTGRLVAGMPGEYRFAIKANGGFRLFLGDELVVDAWGPGEQSRTFVRAFEESAELPIRLEYFHESAGGTAPAALSLEWSVPPADAGFTAALEQARAADAIVFVGGINAQLEGEDMRVDFEGFAGGDRTRIELPAVQQQLLEALAATGKPLVFVNLSGGAMAFPWAAEHVGAILQAWYPGQAGGAAVADVLLGRANPAGRLPVTFYRATEDLPAFDDYRMANRTYRYFEGRPLYPFGHGLSYTQFAYDKVSAVAGADGEVSVSIDIANTGDRDGDEVVQVYLQEPAETWPRAQRSLAGFRRVRLAAGTTQTVVIPIARDTFRRWDAEKNDLAVLPGAWRIQVGASSADIRQTTIVQVERLAP